jgi:nucleoside-diphosphate-sugar epimerase
MDLLILGCGFTGYRVASRFLAKGARVTATTREPQRLNLPGANAIRTEDVAAHLRPGMLVLHSIPPDGSSGLVAKLGDLPSRVVYLSSTAVYGSTTLVDEHTPVDLTSDRARARVEAEREVQAGAWSSLILRPAAIYGPGRGIQESMQRGSYSLSDTYVSRIYVDDLAAHAEAALLSSIVGAYPVADEEPCTSRQMAEFCAGLLGVPLGPGHEQPSRFSSNRRVDGSAIRRLLGITLQYPSYRTGVPAALRASL